MGVEHHHVDLRRSGARWSASSERSRHGCPAADVEPPADPSLLTGRHSGRRPQAGFTEQGFENTTVEPIAAAAGLSRTTFFRYDGAQCVRLGPLPAELAADDRRSGHGQPLPRRQ
ncbi:helix-turn-helix domain-containing protein [Streptomyces sp. NPDC005329]|uniref:helix-turn-helix domain-containing protein n=1 Tax=Streptomyces sp. NPDC005329 TaxID=3157034 RepID=UPI0033B41C08